MIIVWGILGVAVVAWLGYLTWAMRWQTREIQLLLLGLKHMAGADKHVGGTGRNRRRTDFRLPVQLGGFLRVLEHARPCRIVDLSRSGAQVKPDGGNFPLGELGVLTIEFGEFDSGSTHVKIVRAIDAAGTYGLQFVDMPEPFADRCAETLRKAFKDQMHPK